MHITFISVHVSNTLNLKLGRFLQTGFINLILNYFQSRYMVSYQLSINLMHIFETNYAFMLQLYLTIKSL